MYGTVVGLYATEDSKRSVHVYARGSPKHESGRIMLISVESVIFQTTSPYSAVLKNKSTTSTYIASVTFVQ